MISLYTLKTLIGDYNKLGYVYPIGLLSYNKLMKRENIKRVKCGGKDLWLQVSSALFTRMSIQNNKAFNLIIHALRLSIFFSAWESHLTFITRRNTNFHPLNLNITIKYKWYNYIFDKFLYLSPIQIELLKLVQEFSTTFTFSIYTKCSQQKLLFLNILLREFITTHTSE